MRLLLAKRRGLLAAAGVAITLAAAGGIADASLQSRIGSIKQQADALSSKIGATSDKLAALSAQANAARARIAGLTRVLRSGEARSNQLAAQQTTEQHRLDQTTAQLHRAQAVLADRLVAIYKNGEPNYVQLLLGSKGFDDLATRDSYLQAIANADTTIADRVRSLNDAVGSEYKRIAELKRQVDDHNRQLDAARTQVAAARTSLQSQAGELAAARGQEQSALAALRSKITNLESQIGRNAVSQLFGNGHWAIPAYIVICESGGNYRAVNPSSGAGGAYQIMPATWRAYGGTGLPQDAPPAEQDRIAGMIWRNSGPSQWSCA